MLIHSGFNIITKDNKEIRVETNGDFEESLELINDIKKLVINKGWRIGTE